MGILKFNGELESTNTANIYIYIYIDFVLGLFSRGKILQQNA